MKRTSFIASVVFTVLSISSIAMASEGFKLIHVNDLQAAITANSTAVHIYDANTEETRKKDGLIPGAVALNSSSRYDTSTLPTDKKSQLVFYCANTQCMASHTAAKRAVAAGYSNVSVMADGIQGWKKAGMKTQ